MKALPCDRCKGQALGPASGKFPQGEPLYAGKVHSWPCLYKCSRCKTTTRLTKDRFNLLQEVPEVDLKQHFAKAL